MESPISERVENYIKIKDIEYDIMKVLKYFTELKKDYRKFNYNEALCMSELLSSTVNYLQAYVEAKNYSSLE